MNKLSFAVAAVYGASMAKAQACQPLPDQSITDKMALAELNYSYLDSCTQDGRVTKEEFDALVGDIGEGGADSADTQRKFELIDLDINGEISLVELLRYYQVKYSPIDLQGSLPPFTEVRVALFDYLRCRPKPSTDLVQECTATGYTKEDLKAVLPLMYVLDNVIGDYLSYEAYVDHEFSIRDTNYNGIVEQWEQDKYDGHYKWIRGFWNYSKGAGNVQETLEDDGIMTFEQWNKQDNMMLKRDYPTSDIPEERINNSWRWYDKNVDGKVIWYEYWTTIQQADLQFHHFIALLNEIDQDDDSNMSRDEVTAYYQAQGLTDAEVQAKVDEMFMKYNDGETNGEGDDLIGKWEMWGKYNYHLQLIEEARRKAFRSELGFESQVWKVWDDNGDRVWSYDELINHMSIEDAAEIFTSIGKDPLTEDLTHAEVKAFVMDKISLYKKWVKNGRADWPRSISTIDTSNPDTQAYLGVDSQAALDALFAEIDLNGNGDFEYTEMCRHFVHDSDWFCAGDQVKVDYDPIQPDYMVPTPPTPFELFWGQLDDAHLNPDGSVELENWQMATAGVALFEAMNEAEVLDQFDIHDLNDDGTVTYDEAYQVFTQDDTAEDDGQADGN